MMPQMQKQNPDEVYFTISQTYNRDYLDYYIQIVRVS